MKRTGGYTLLEMVVVMAVLALATALVAPPGYKMVRSWQDASRVDDVFKQLRALPMSVRDTGHEITVRPDQPDDAAPLVQLPDGWQLHFDTELRIRSNGACSDASAVLITGHQRLPFEIEAPFCRIVRL